jgi:hypothetical protein
MSWKVSHNPTPLTANDGVADLRYGTISIKCSKLPGW